MRSEVSGGGNVVYYINEDAGVVVAKINAERYEPFNITESIINKIRSADEHNTPYDVFACGGFKKLGLDKAYTGVARCSPEDTFDVDAGKRIALARAQVKYHEALSGSLSAIAAYFEGISAAVYRRVAFENIQAHGYEIDIDYFLSRGRNSQ